MQLLYLHEILQSQQPCPKGQNAADRLTPGEFSNAESGEFYDTDDTDQASGRSAFDQPGARRNCKPSPASEQDLILMRVLDELHLNYPFVGSRMLRDLLRHQRVDAGRLHIGTLMEEHVDAD